MASGPGARARAGDPVAQLTMGRCADAAARRLSAPLHFVATAVRAVRSGRHPVGDCFLHLVSRRPERSPRREPLAAGAASALEGDGCRPRAERLAGAGIEPDDLADLRGVGLARLWLVVIHHLGADLSE